jgi:hypothetical protein
MLSVVRLVIVNGVFNPFMNASAVSRQAGCHYSTACHLGGQVEMLCVCVCVCVCVYARALFRKSDTKTGDISTPTVTRSFVNRYA